MKFKKIFKQKIRMKKMEDIRLGIYCNHNEPGCSIKLTEDLADKIFLDNGAYVSVYYAEENPKIIFLKKTLDSDNSGYKISYKSSAKSYLGFRFNLPHEIKSHFKDIKGIREVQYDFFEDGLRIYCL